MRVHAIVSGRVQGVGFRFYARSAATRLGLAGFVRNLADGRVEVSATGDRRSLEALLAALRRGPAGAAVRGVDAEWTDGAEAAASGSGAARQFTIR